MTNRHWIIAVFATLVIGGWLTTNIIETISEGPEIDPIVHYTGFIDALSVNDVTTDEALSLGYYICDEYPRMEVEQWDRLVHYNLGVNLVMFGINMDDTDRIVRITHMDLCPLY